MPFLMRMVACRLKIFPILKNEKVKLLFLIKEDDERLFYNVSLSGLSNAYPDNEPDYDLGLVNEPNVAYAAK